MRRLPLIVTLCLLLAVTTTWAQTPFTVLAVRGEVTNGKKAIKVGNELSTSDRISVKPKGYISLAHKNGKAVEINKTGSYPVKDLDKAASGSSSTSSQKFARYVVDELTELEDPVEFTSGRRGKMRTTGSVERAMGDDVSVFDSVLTMVGAPNEMAALAGKQNHAVNTGEFILVLTPRDTRLIGSQIECTWRKAPNVTEYVVTISDRANATVFSKKTTDTSVVVDLNEFGMKKGELYFWKVASTTNPKLTSEQFALYREVSINEMEAQKIEAAIAVDYDADNTAVGKLVLATAYEDLGLSYDAHKAYQAAIAMAPSVKNYQRMYAQFLKRHGLNALAYSVYE